ncbi:MAG TPA: hypothetical protein VFQ45_09865 [Longimicrobium sp.]|nr:hypothetical protein [Longimicrobium sp.]
MPLDYIPTHAAPGDPVTADAWNALVDGLSAAQEVLKAATGTGRVLLTAQNLDPQQARVTAVRAGAPPVEAVPPVAGDPHFILPRLPAGSYVVHASAPGFTPAQGALTIGPTGTPSVDPLNLALPATQGRMPNVLGAALPAAVGALSQVQLRILDTHGVSLPASGFASAYIGLPVLMQWPAPGELAPPSGTMAQIVVAAPPQAAPPPVQMVTVPNVIGMTPSAAQTTIQAAGLVYAVGDPSY